MAVPTLDPLTAHQTILNNLLNILSTESAYQAVNGPKPMYSVGGRSFNWPGFLQVMADLIEKEQRIVNMLDTTEIHVRGYTGY